MNTTIKISVPGKVHLIGEHAIVYGKPALLAAINKRLTVILSLTDTQASHPEITLQTNASKEVVRVPLAAFLQEEGQLQIESEEVAYMLLALREACHYYSMRLTSGFSLTIDSAIPMGSGLGSSAAVAVGIVAALSIIFTGTLQKEIVTEIATAIERKRHPNASGADITVVCYGGIVWCNKQENGRILFKHIASHFSLDHFYLLQTGRPNENTGEMVAAVADLHQVNPHIVETFLKNQETLTQIFLPVVSAQQPEDIINLISQSQKNLESIGVVSKHTHEIVTAIEKSGGAAKISGAGGKKEGSGMLLVYHPMKEKLEAIAQSFQTTIEPVTLDMIGVKQA